MIIRYKYPLYPDIGEAATIEAEREALINEISTYELQGFNRRPDRCQSRLYDYILAKLTNTEKKQHVHRVDRAYQHFEKKMFKPFVNDVFYIVTFGKWVPFKRSPIGMAPGIGGMSGVGGLQFNYGFGSGFQLYISAGSNPYMLYDSKADRQDNLPTIRMVPQSVFEPVRFPMPGSSSSVDSALAISVVSNPGMSIDNLYLQSAINDFYQETFPSIRTENTTKGKSVSPRKAPRAVTQQVSPHIQTKASVSPVPAEVSYHFRDSTLKQRASYRDEYGNYLGTGKKILIGVGRQLTQTAQGVKQLGLETGEKLGVVKKGAAAQYTAVVNKEKQVYKGTPVAKSTPGKVGQYGTEMLIAAALPASTGLKAAKLIAAGAAAGAALGGVQVTEEGTLTARGKQAAVGAAIGAGGALVIGKASAAIKAAASKIGAATKASKKPAAILNQYNLRPRTSSPNYVGGSKSTTRTSVSKPGLPLTQYENVKIVNPHTTTNPSHNPSNVNAQAALNKGYARNYFNVSNQSHYDLHRTITSKSLNDLAKPIDKNLINKLVEKGWKIDIAKPGSDDWKWLNMNGADASFNSGVSKHILLKEGAPKSALLEEFLHGTQTNLGLLEKYGTPQALEVHVKDFMLRHVKLLGLNNPHDIRLLQQLKVEEINRLKDLKL